MKAKLIGGPSKDTDIVLDEEMVARCVAGGQPMEIRDPYHSSAHLAPQCQPENVNSLTFTFSVYGYSHWDIEQKCAIFNFIR